MGWGEVESESFFGWNSERPRKTIGLCCLTIARELPRGTHLPWVPTFCTDKLYKMWGGKVRELPLGESTQLLWNNRNSEAITMMEQRCHLTVQQQGQFLAYMCDFMCLVNFFWSGISCAHASHQKMTELSSTPCKFWTYVRTSPHKFCICNQTSSTVKVRLPIHAPHLTLPRQLYLNKNIWAK